MAWDAQALQVFFTFCAAMLKRGDVVDFLRHRYPSRLLTVQAQRVRSQPVRPALYSRPTTQPDVDWRGCARIKRPQARTETLNP